MKPMKVTLREWIVQATKPFRSLAARIRSLRSALALSESQVLFRKNAIGYTLFVLLFWMLLFLVRSHGFSENTTLFAVGVTIIPFLVLFVPAFQRVVTRLSSVKIAGFELTFPKAIEESITGSAPEQLLLAIDPGRQQEYAKANLSEFIEMVKRYLPNRATRLVVSVDLRDDKQISLTMLYFQARYLEWLFDLRAFLFIDSSQKPHENWILGTVHPGLAFRAMEHFVKDLDKAFSEAFQPTSSLDRPFFPESHINSAWYDFTERLVEFRDRDRLTAIMFREIFGGRLERNIISYPIQKEAFMALFEYLEPSHKHLILVKGLDIVNVRTIDRVAREIARKTIEIAVQQEAVKQFQSRLNA